MMRRWGSSDRVEGSAQQAKEKLDRDIKLLKAHQGREGELLENLQDVNLSAIKDAIDFFKRRADIENRYASDMMKLIDRYKPVELPAMPQKGQKEKSIPPNLPRIRGSLSEPFAAVVLQHKQIAMQHAQAAEYFSKTVSQQLQTTAKLYANRCDEIRALFSAQQDKVAKSLSHLLNCLNAYQDATSAHLKVVKSLNEAREKDKGGKNEEKIKKLNGKLEATSTALIRTRNAYLLAIDQTNATLEQFYGHDLDEVIRAQDVTLYNGMRNFFRGFCDAQMSIDDSGSRLIAQVLQNTESLSTEIMKEYLRKMRGDIFTPPMTDAYGFAGAAGDEVSKLMPDDDLLALFDRVQGRYAELSEELATYGIGKQHISNPATLAYYLTRQLEFARIKTALAKLRQSSDGLAQSSVLGMVFRAKERYNPEKEEHLALAPEEEVVIIAHSKAKNGTEEIVTVRNQYGRVGKVRMAVLEKYDIPSPDAEDEDPIEGSYSDSWNNRRKYLTLRLMKRPGLELLREQGIAKADTFGTNLEEICRLHKTKVPPVVLHCVDFLDDPRALELEGLFRVSGSVARVQKLRVAYNDPVFDLRQTFEGKENLISLEDFHDIASLMKMYLRDLPVSVIPPMLYRHLIGTCAPIEDPNLRYEEIDDLLDLAPECHRETLLFIIRFLRKVASNSSKNMMTPSNLAVVFGPTLLRNTSEDGTALDDPMSAMRDAASQSLIVQTLIEGPEGATPGRVLTQAELRQSVQSLHERVEEIHLKEQLEQQMLNKVMRKNESSGVNINPPPLPPRGSGNHRRAATERASLQTASEPGHRVTLSEKSPTANGEGKRERLARRSSSVIHDFEADDLGQMSVEAGQTVYPTGEINGDWALVEKEDQLGWVPQSCIDGETA
eukprot:Clim_evm11s42 gene=Clim_evmTU11s42